MILTTVLPNAPKVCQNPVTISGILDVCEEARVPCEGQLPWHGLPVTGPILRQRDASAYMGVSRSTFYRLVSEGALPKPINLTANAKGFPRPWLDAVLAAWAAQPDAAYER